MHARRGGDEGRRVYERGDEPAGVWACDRAARQRSKLHGDAGQQPLHRAISSGERSRGERASERRRGCRSRRGRGGRWPRRARRGASLTVGRLLGRRPGDGEGVRGNRGNRGGARAGQLAGRDGGLGASAPADGGDGGAWAVLAGKTRQFAVDHGRARTVVGAALASWRWASGAAGGILGGGPGGEGGAPMGRRDAGAVARGPAAGAGSTSSWRYIMSPWACTACMCIYVDALSPPPTTEFRPTRGDGLGDI